jgi:hypothetical protein
MVSSLVIHSDLNFIGLVNGEFVDLIWPFVVSGRLRAPLDCVFDLDVDKCFWTATEATCSRVVDVGNFPNA